MMRKHLAVLKREYIGALIAGRKTIEARLTRTRREPWGQIEAGDFVYLKRVGGGVCGTARVAGVKSFEGLDEAGVAEIKERYNSEILGDEEYWGQKSDSRYGVLVWLDDVKAVESVQISKRDQVAWRVLREDLNYGLGY